MLTSVYYYGIISIELILTKEMIDMEYGENTMSYNHPNYEGEEECNIDISTIVINDWYKVTDSDDLPF